MHGNIKRKGQRQVIKIYRKTATITAEQFDGSDEMMKRYDIENSADSGYNDSDWEDEGPCIPTSEGYLRINEGDWIATGVDGEHWPIADSIFKKTYAELPVIPLEVARLIMYYHWNHSLTTLMQDASNFHSEHSELEWILKHDDKTARAWLDGYQVEEEDK